MSDYIWSTAILEKFAIFCIIFLKTSIFYSDGLFRLINIVSFLRYYIFVPFKI